MNKKIYDNNKFFQLGNLLYFLLHAYVDRVNKKTNSYVLKAGYYNLCTTMFPKTTELFSKAEGRQIYFEGYHQVHNKDYTSQELDDFIKIYLLEDLIKKAKTIENKDITIAIRRTDFLDEKRKYLYGYNAVKYVLECLEDTTREYKELTLRITSDDVEWVQKTLVPKIKNKYKHISDIIVEEKHIMYNFLQLFSTSKYFISPNSTYCYWVGYCLRLAYPNVKVYVPNFNTELIENGKQIADTRNWIKKDIERIVDKNENNNTSSIRKDDR